MRRNRRHILRKKGNEEGYSSDSSDEQSADGNVDEEAHELNGGGDNEKKEFIDNGSQTRYGRVSKKPNYLNYTTLGGDN